MIEYHNILWYCIEETILNIYSYMKEKNVTELPRTQIEDLSVPRLIPGTNWFVGYSHTSAAQDKLIKEFQTREKLADLLEVFFRAGADAIYGGAGLQLGNAERY